MAKVVVAGNAVTVTSTMKLEDLKTIEKYRPKALVLTGGEDGKEPIFAISTKSSKVGGEISKYGASFCVETHDEKKLAVITLFYDIKSDNVKELVADALGSAIINIDKLEKTLPAVLTEIKNEREAIMSNITVIM